MGTAKTKKMDPKVKARWVRALKSGKYEQGRAALKRIFPDGIAKHCCLGVLCELFPKEGTTLKFESVTDDDRLSFGRCTRIGARYNFSFLPPTVAKWAGIPKHDYKNRKNDIQDVLARMNDEGNSFEEIAAYIKANL